MGRIGMCISGAHVENINNEVINILKELGNEKDKTSEKYAVLSCRLNNMLEALDRAADLMITRFNYEVVEKEWEDKCFNHNDNNRRIGFTNSKA